MRVVGVVRWRIRTRSSTDLYANWDVCDIAADTSLADLGIEHNP